MKGYKIPEGRVEGFKRWIEKYPKDMEYAWGMSAIVEALEIYPLEELDENPWHTGTPTEEGWYLIKYKHNGGIRYIAMENPSKWVFINDDTLAWQKIEEN